MPKRFCVLLKDALNTSDYIKSNIKMNGEKLFVNDLEGSSCDIIKVLL
jgi:hypothetical protein